jgi:hypothetical protein
MLGRIAFAFLISVIPLASIANSEPSKLACSYYLNVEADLKCIENRGDDSNYLTEFGYRYCRKFSNLHDDNADNKDLRKWIEDTRLCLQQSVKDIGTVKCKDLESKAIASHRPCYVSNGICAIKSRWPTILATIFGFDLLGNASNSIHEAALITLDCIKNAFSGFFLISELFIGTRSSDMEARRMAVEIINMAPQTSMSEFNSYFAVVESSYFAGPSSEARAAFSEWKSQMKANESYSHRRDGKWVISGLPDQSRAAMQKEESLTFKERVERAHRTARSYKP